MIVLYLKNCQRFFIWIHFILRRQFFSFGMKFVKKNIFFNILLTFKEYNIYIPYDHKNRRQIGLEVMVNDISNIIFHDNDHWLITRPTLTPFFSRLYGIFNIRIMYIEKWQTIPKSPISDFLFRISFKNMPARVMHFFSLNLIWTFFKQWVIQHMIQKFS